MADEQVTRVQKIEGVIAVTILMLFPFAASAQVVISEIMYDAPGTEGSGEHDWIEIFNSGESAMDVSAYRFFEAGTNHMLKLASGSPTLPSGGYAVIASATSTFLADWPAFTGTLFDSSFNLNSSGELIGIRADTSDTTHDFTYSPADAATNNGSSLQRVSVGGTSFITGTPSPGTGSLASSSGSGTTNTNQNEQSGNPTPTTTTTTSSANATVPTGSNFPVEPQIFAYAGKDREAIAGADSIFEASAFNKKKEPIKPERFLWTFGDGGTAEGQSVMHHFAQPGKYAVVLDITAGLFSAEHQIIVTVQPVSVTLSLNNGDFVLSNNSTKNLDLSYWSLRSGGKLFMIPKNTIVLGSASVPFTREVTNLEALNDSALLYPNGAVAATTSLHTAPVSAPMPSPVPAAPPATHVKKISKKTKAVASTASAPTSNVPATIAADPVDTNVEIATTSQPIATTDVQTASAATAVETGAGESNRYIWWLGAIGLAIAGGGVIFASRRAGKREWDIVEEREG